MTPEDIQFIREMNEGAKSVIQAVMTTTTPLDGFVIQATQEAHIKLRLLALLVEAEVQARYWHHFAHAHLADSPICNRRNHTFNEFETQVKKELGI